MATLRHLDLPNGERNLIATLLRPDSPPSGAAVLFIHGLGSSRVTNIERAQVLSQSSGAIGLAIDLGGHGDSQGQLSQMTPRANLSDVVAAHDLLASVPGVNPARIGLCAASYGAYLAILCSALRPVSRMLLRAPALYADDCFDSGLGQRRRGQASSAPTLLAHFALFGGPVTIVESERDEVISHDTILTYLNAQPRARHVVLPGARHALTEAAWRADYQRLVVDFFADL